MNKTPEILRKQRKGLDKKKKKSVKCTTSETYCSGRKMEKQGEEPRKRPGNMVKNHKTEGLKAVKTSGNIYYQARMRAAARDPLHSSRERTATLLYISKESLQDFETGKRLPPCDVVQKMVEAYGAPELAGDHIRACCPLLPDYGGDGNSELALAALGWAASFEDAQQLAVRFAAVARDGKITSNELPAVDAIRRKAVELRRVMEETVLAIDKAMAQMEGKT